MKKITLVAGFLLSALVLFGAMGCSSGGGGSDDDGVSYSSGSGSGSSSGGSGTRTYTSVAGGTFKYISPLAASWQSYTFNANGTYVFNVSTGETSTGTWTAEGTTIYINSIPFTANSSFTQISMSSAQVFTRQ
ncbi:MAG TPA: hypothetical protein DCZ76_04805 [Treponema sp.]|nr:hypothetical protein [Treponema sp.]